MELMGTAGIDVSLIGALGEQSLSSTDRLVLESLDRDFVILSQHPPTEAIAALRTLQIVGRRAAHRFDREAESGGGRRIFCLCWRDFESSAAIADALREILLSLQVVAVPIGLAPANSKVSSPAKLPASPVASPAAKEIDSAQSPSHSHGIDRSATPEPSNAEATRTEPQPAAARRERISSADLDQLVDGLNDLDI